MQILIIGKTGQLGNSIQDVATEALYSEHNFTFAGRDVIDLSNNTSISKYFKDKCFDVVVNCAAYTQVDKAEKEQTLANQINHLAVVQLAQIAQRSNTKLIHVSTDYVFNGNTDIPYMEVDTPNPINTYGKTKLLGERAVQNTMSNNAIIIRSSWIYSQHGHNFVNTMLRLAKDKNELAIVSDQIGTPTYAQDLASAILHIINSKVFANDFNTEVYHYSNIGQCSWYEFAKEIFSVQQIKSTVIPIATDAYPTPAKRPHYTVLNKDKIITTFGVKIPSWQSSLKACLAKI